MVTMHLVESSSIRAIGYDEEVEELWIQVSQLARSLRLFGGSGGGLWRVGRSRIEERGRQSDDQAVL